MKSQDHQLIALSHILFRYRLTGELPNIDGKPFNLDDFKAKLFAGATSDDMDININIDTLKTESNVTIIENQTVDCDEHEHRHESSHKQEEEPTKEPEKSNLDAPAPSGKLFSYFNRDRG